MNEHSESDAADKYTVACFAPCDLAEQEFATCTDIAKNGDAVDPDSAAAEIPRAAVLAIAKIGDEIVGVGAIKRVRTDYAARIANRSGVDFDPLTPELGYVAVDRAHQRRGALSPDRGKVAFGEC